MKLINAPFLLFFFSHSANRIRYLNYSKNLRRPTAWDNFCPIIDAGTIHERPLDSTSRSRYHPSSPRLSFGKSGMHWEEKLLMWTGSRPDTTNYLQRISDSSFSNNKSALDLQYNNEIDPLSSFPLIQPNLNQQPKTPEKVSIIDHLTRNGILCERIRNEG